MIVMLPDLARAYEHFSSHLTNKEFKTCFVLACHNKNHFHFVIYEDDPNIYEDNPCSNSFLSWPNVCFASRIQECCYTLEGVQYGQKILPLNYK
jgi:hypothetical protein